MALKQKAHLWYGITGEVGSIVFKELIEKFPVGEHVIIDLPDKPGWLGKLSRQNNLNIHYHKKSITDEEFLRQILKTYQITHVWNFAGILSGTAATKPELAYEVNVKGALLIMNMLEKQMLETKKIVRYLFPSSIGVFNNPNSITREKLHEKGGQDVDDFATSESAYGSGKLEVEKAMKEFKKKMKGLFIPIIFRLPGVLNPWNTPEGGTTDVIPLLVKAAILKKKAKLFLDENISLPFIMAEKMAVTFIKAMMETTPEKTKYVVYQIMEFSISIRECAYLLNSLNVKTEYEIEEDPVRNSFALQWCISMNCLRAQEDFGFEIGLDDLIIYIERYLSLMEEVWEKE